MKKFFKKHFMWAIVYSVLLTGFTFYVVMDTFVIEKRYGEVKTSTEDVDAFFDKFATEDGSNGSEGIEEDSAQIAESGNESSADNQDGLNSESGVLPDGTQTDVPAGESAVPGESAEPGESTSPDESAAPDGTTSPDGTKATPAAQKKTNSNKKTNSSKKNTGKNKNNSSSNPTVTSNSNQVASNDNKNESNSSNNSGASVSSDDKKDDNKATESGSNNSSDSKKATATPKAKNKATATPKVKATATPKPKATHSPSPKPTVVPTPTTRPNGVIATYSSDDINITITQKSFMSTKNNKNTDYYVADIKLSSAKYFKTAFAENTFGKNIKQKTSAIASAHNAIFAINGDFYGYRDNGYVIRNGELFREDAWGHESLVVDANGAFKVVKEADTTAKELLNGGAWQVFTFGPGLVVDGSIHVSDGQEVEQALAGNPRTAIGMVKPLHYKALVSDGRTDTSYGLTLFELANLMKEEGCATAYNLDGGGTATMWYKGEVINHPTDGTNVGERRVSDIVYFGKE